MSLPSTRPASFDIQLASGTHAYLCADCKGALTRRRALSSDDGMAIVNASDVVSVAPAPDDAVCVWCE